AGLSALELAGNRMRADGLQALLCSPHLGRLHTLAARGNHLFDAGAPALAATNWPRLRRLDLSNNRMGQAGAQARADSPRRAGRAGAQALEDARRMAGVTDLDLRQTWLRAPGVRVLVSSPHLARLRTLRLARTYIGDRGAAALAAAPHLAELTALDLGSNSVT